MCGIIALHFVSACCLPVCFNAQHQYCACVLDRFSIRYSPLSALQAKCVAFCFVFCEVGQLTDRCIVDICTKIKLVTSFTAS